MLIKDTRYLDTNPLNYHPEIEVYIDRLTKEWIKHERLIIGVDFDDTVFQYGADKRLIPWIEKAIDELKLCQEVGALITVFTASVTSRYDFIRAHYEKIGLKIASININAAEIVFGNNGRPGDPPKIYANIFIDDRAALPQSLQILNLARIRFVNFKKMIQI